MSTTANRTDSGMLMRDHEGGLDILQEDGQHDDVPVQRPPPCW
ncbi:MAG: hypothetical protein ACLVJH_19115 [Faecalibacterium prausnitzii]